MAETVSIRVTQSGAEAVSGAMDEVGRATREIAQAFREVAPEAARVAQDTERVAESMHEAASGAQEFHDAAHQTVQSAEEQSGAFGSILRASKQLLVSYALLTVANATFTHGLAGTVQELKTGVFQEVTALSRALRSLGFERAAEAVNRFVSVMQGAFRPLEVAVFALQNAWHRAMLAMANSSSAMVNRLGATFERIGFAVRQLGEVGAAITQPILDGLSAIGRGARLFLQGLGSLVVDLVALFGGMGREILTQVGTIFPHLRAVANAVLTAIGWQVVHLRLLFTGLKMELADTAGAMAKLGVIRDFVVSALDALGVTRLWAAAVERVKAAMDAVGITAAVARFREFAATIRTAVVGSLGEFGQKLAAVRKSMLATVTTARVLGAALLAAFALIIGGVITAALVRLAAQGAALVPIQNAFRNLSDEVGTTAHLLLTDLKAATLDTVASVDLMRSSVLALNSGAIKTRAGLKEVATAAQVLGQTVGIDTAEAFDNIVRGIGLVNPQLIKSVGVLVSAEDAYRKYADQVGKSVQALDDHERKEAFRIEVMEKLSEAVRRVDADQNSLSNSLQRLSATAKNWGNVIVSQIAQSRQLSNLVGTLTSLFAAFTTVLEKHIPVVEKVTDVWFGLVNAGLLLIPGVGLARNLQKVTDQNEDFARSVQEVGRAMAVLRDPDAVELLPREELLKLGVAADQVRELGEAFLDDRSEETQSALVQATQQLAAMTDRAHRLAEETLEVRDLWAGMPAPIARSSENLERFAEGLTQAESAIQDARVQAELIRAEYDSITDPARRDELLTQWTDLQTEIATARVQVGFYEQALEESLGAANQIVSAANETIDAQAQLAGEISLVTSELWAQYEIEGSIVERIMSQAEATRVAAEERRRLNALVEESLQQQGIISGGPSGFSIQDARGAGISPFGIGGTVDTEAFRESLMSMAEMARVQEEWSLVLRGNEDALMRLVEAGVLTEEEALKVAEALGRIEEGSSVAGQALVTTLGGAIETLVIGTENAAETIIRTATRLAQIQLAEEGLPFIGSIVGAIGGIASALFRRDRQKVEVDRYSQQALSQRRRNEKEGPSTVIVQIIDPNTGEITSQTVQQLNRLEARDAVQRVPSQTARKVISRGGG